MDSHLANSGLSSPTARPVVSKPLKGWRRFLYQQFQQCCRNSDTVREEAHDVKDRERGCSGQVHERMSTSTQASFLEEEDEKNENSSVIKDAVQEASSDTDLERNDDEYADKDGSEVEDDSNKNKVSEDVETLERIIFLGVLENDQRIEENQQDGPKLDSEAQEVKADLGNLRREKEELEQGHELELDNLRRQEQELKQKIEEMRIRHVTTSIHQMTWELNNKWNEIADKKNQLADVQSQHQQIVASLDEAALALELKPGEHLCGKIQELKQQLEKEERLRDELTHHNNKLVEGHQVAHRENQDLRRKLDQLQERNEELKRKFDAEVRLRTELSEQLNELTKQKIELTNLQRENRKLHRQHTQEINELRLKCEDGARALKDAHEESQKLRDEMEQNKVNHAAHIGFMETSMSNATSCVNNLELDSARNTIRALETQLESTRSQLQSAAESGREAIQQGQQKETIFKEQLSTHRLQTGGFPDEHRNLRADPQTPEEKPCRKRTFASAYKEEVQVQIGNKRQKTSQGFYLQGPKKMMHHPEILKQVDSLKRTIQAISQQKLSGSAGPEQIEARPAS
jgi:DNA repair exonuclease SbcCD ATPase subunit